jgi:SH3-like domain-containing protein
MARQEATLKQARLIFLTIFAIMAIANPAAAERVSVAADIANVRAQPDANAAVIWQVERYHPLNVVNKQDDWVLFEDFEGDRGWIHNSLLTDLDAVIVKKDSCNVRSGPGTDTDIRFTVDKGVPFKVLKKEGKWINVVHADGDDGWIHQSLVW